MAKYSDLIYGTGVFYGEKGKLALSAEPMSATAIDYGVIQLKYTIPSGDYVGFRVVRNQDSFPETEDDGVILVEKIPGVEGDLETSIIDSDENSVAPLQLGRFTYYRAWILVTTDASWVAAGDAYTLSPLSNGITFGAEAVESVYGGVNLTSDKAIVNSYELSSTHRRFLDTLPRVLTSATNNPVDEINDPNGVQDGENTVISQFLSAFSFTLDEVFTNISLINPNITGWSTNPSVLQLMAHEFGIEGTSGDITKTAKRLIREAPYIYKRKGTLSGLSAYVEAITGFDATITSGKNLLLSYEDSTFFIPDWNDGVIEEVDPDPVGGWGSVVEGLSLSVSAEVLTATSEPASLDDNYMCKAVVTSTGSTMELGTNAPELYGIPVTAGEQYSFSTYIRRASTMTAVEYDSTLKINWYDKQGSFISQDEMDAAFAVDDGQWDRISLEGVVAPSKAVYAGLVIQFDVNGTYYIDMVQFEKSQEMTSYEEPRSVDIFLNPTRTNYFTNPSFEGNPTGSLTGWTAKATSTSTVTNETKLAPAWSGNQWATLTSDASAPMGLESAYIDVTPGQQYYTYMHVKDFNAARNFVASVKFYDSTNTLVGTAVTGIPTAISKEYWTKVGVGVTVPIIRDTDNTIKPIKVKVSFLSETTPVSGKSVYFDAAIFIDGNGPVSYFDGSYQDRGCAWAGTANNSISYFYPNRSQKLDRLAATIKSMIPMQTPYYIDAHGIDYLEGTFSGIS
jgi:hypothetical protein